MIKRCSRCGNVKPLSRFNKNSGAKDRLDCWCKDCRRPYMRTYLATMKDWREKNPGWDKFLHERWNNNNCPLRRMYSARWRLGNLELSRESRRNNNHQRRAQSKGGNVQLEHLSYNLRGMSDLRRLRKCQ